MENFAYRTKIATYDGVSVVHLAHCSGLVRTPAITRLLNCVQGASYAYSMLSKTAMQSQMVSLGKKPSRSALTP